MKKFLLLLIVLTIVLIAFFLFNVKDKAEYVLYIESTNDEYIKSGVGIPYKVNGSKTYILTLYHIIDSSSSIYVYDNFGNRKVAQLLNYNASEDLAVLIVHNFKTNILKKSKCEYSIGDKITISGISDKKKINKKGIIIDDNIDIDIDYSYGRVRYNTFKFEADVIPGDSGSIVLDSKKNAIGIVALKDLENNYAYSIPICKALKVVSKLESAS